MIPTKYDGEINTDHYRHKPLSPTENFFNLWLAHLINITHFQLSQPTPLAQRIITTTLYTPFNIAISAYLAGHNKF